MWLIDKPTDELRPNGSKIYVRLKADKPIVSYYISYPITWEGFIGGEKIKIIQTSESSISMDDFNFIEMPEHFTYQKSFILDLINNYLRNALK